MNLFDSIVADAMRGQDRFAPIQAVVEKELLHHDILREMNEAGFLSRLVFIGGTCLRACYGASRLSEDLDFTGGADFARETLASVRDVLTTHRFGRVVMSIPGSFASSQGRRVRIFPSRGFISIFAPSPVMMPAP